MQSMKVLAFPFRFNLLQPGTFARVEQGSDAHKAQEVQCFFLTHKGERPIYQEYGISDPTFNSFDESEAAATFATFYQTIELNTITVNPRGDGTTAISVEFK